MIGKLLDWAIHNRVVVVLLALTLVVTGGFAVTRVNVEAYPDPAPAIIGVAAIYPGASAEEVERQLIVPMEVALAGMPGLKYTRSKSMFGLAYMLNQFNYGVDFKDARQEVINRLAQAQLPKGVVPQLTPASCIDEIYRYTLRSPKDALGRDIYTLYDLKALQDWTLDRELSRIPRVAGITGCGGMVKRYEIHPDPDRLKEYGITLQQLETAIASSNANVGGNLIVQGGNVQVVRGIGLIGGGEDPMVYAATKFTNPVEAAAYLRAEERRRIAEIREIVITATDNVPIRVEHVVEGGPLRSGGELGKQGVVVGHHTRQGKISFAHPKWDKDGHEVLVNGQRIVEDEDEKVQGIILLRKGEQSLPTLEAAREKIRELNETPGTLLPGVKIEPYYNRTTLIDVTTATVRKNLMEGMVLVTIILLMFISNVRTALIVAINVPLALLFAFGVLYLRGRSANLLSIGAVDFGIIVDSTVIMVENIYRRLSSTTDVTDEPLTKRILRAAREVERSLFFSTLIMVCALLPLFTMQGPEGQIFGPMADTYAFALAGALMLALTISPVLCVFFFKKLKPARDNLLVRSLKRLVLWQLNWVLDHRVWVLGCTLGFVAATLGTLPFLGREFMPELEEGNMVVRGIFPVNISLDETARNARIARKILMSFPEVDVVASQIGRPDDGMDPSGAFEMQCFVPLKPPDQWPIPSGRKHPRPKSELIDTMSAELSRNIIGVDWDFSQIIRDDVMESLSGVKGENSVKIFGPDLNELERLAADFNHTLSKVPGVFDPGVFRIKGQTNLAFPIDRAKCALWNVSVADVEDVIQTAVGGMPFSEMTEGEKKFDISLRWPESLRENPDAILNIPVDVVKNNVTAGGTGQQSPGFSGSAGLSVIGTTLSMPALTGRSGQATASSLSHVPRRRLRDLVTPVDDEGLPDPKLSFVRTGASTINREQGQRLIAVKFGVRVRDLASTVAEAQEKTDSLLKPPYRTTWSGEFQQMQEAEKRMLKVVAVSLLLILVMLYLAFYSLLDALLVYANVIAMSLGGLWALILTGLNFNISAAVGFISILGVSVMNGLLMVSAFNNLRYKKVPLREAIVQSTEKLVRPITMTALAAILGLLPAAFSTQIGSQSQRPLAIVVVGGMLSTLVFFNLVPFLYSFYGHREPLVGVGHVHE